MIASKAKKKGKGGKVEPLIGDVELDELGSPPSTSDLGELFDSPRRTSEDGRQSSVGGALTETTNLDDVISPRDSITTTPKKSAGAGDDQSSRSSTPSSARAMVQRHMRKNIVTPINDPIKEDDTLDNLPLIPGVEAWSESGSSNESRPGSAPPVKSRTSLEVSRPMSAPSKSPRLNRVNQISPASSGMITPVGQKTGMFDATSSARSTPVEARNLAWDGEFDMVKPIAPTPRESKVSRPSQGSIAGDLDISTTSIKNAWADTSMKDDSDIVNEGEYNRLEDQDEDKEAAEILRADTPQEVTEAVLAPLQTVGEHHAYIPMEYAKQCIQKVIEDMKLMKANHFNIIKEIQVQYDLIEQESQAQFNAYVIKLRGEYNTKVATFRNVIEAHATDFRDKQKFYEEAIRSLRERNRSMLVEKKNYLTKMKDKNVWFEQEKLRITGDLTNMLDKKHSEFVILSGTLSAAEKENSAQAVRIRELEARNAELEKKVELTCGESDKLATVMKDEMRDLRSKLKESDQATEELKASLEKLENEKREELEVKEKIIQEQQQQLNAITNRPVMDRTTSSTGLVPLIERTTSTAQLPTVAEQQTSSTGLLAEETTSVTGLLSGQVDAQTSSAQLPSLVDAGTSSSDLIPLADAQTSATVLSSDQQTSATNLTTTTDVQTSATDLARPVDGPTSTTGLLLQQDAHTSAVQIPAVADLAVASSSPISSEELDALNAQIRSLEEELSEVSKSKDEREKELSLEKQKLYDEVQEARNEKNQINLALVESQHRARTLHERLETTLANVADTVDVTETQSKLAAAQEGKSALQSEVDELSVALEEWKAEFRRENDGKEPTDDDRTEEIEGGLQELKLKQENLSSIEKDVLVMNMLLVGALPDDMKEEADGSNTAMGSVAEELTRQFSEERDSLQEQIAALQRDVGERDERIDEQRISVDELREARDELQTEKSDLQETIAELETRIDELERRQPERVVVTTTEEGEEVVVAASEESSAISSEAYAALEARLAEVESENTTETETLRGRVKKLESKVRHLKADKETAAEKASDAESKMKIATDTHTAEMEQKQQELDAVRKDIDALNEARMANVPVDTKVEIQALNDKIRELEEASSVVNTELSGLRIENTEVKAQVEAQLGTIDTLRKQETKHEGDLQKMKDHYDKKIKELKKKAAAAPKQTTPRKISAGAASGAGAGGDDSARVKELEKKVVDLEKQLAAASGKPVAAEKADKKLHSSLIANADAAKNASKLEKQNEVMKEQLATLKKSAQVDADKVKELQAQLKEMKGKTDGKEAQKQKKAMDDLNKKLEFEQKRTAKLKGEVDTTKAELTDLQKSFASLEVESKSDKLELAKLGVAAKEGLQAMERVTELEAQTKQLTEETRLANENYNSERILRKKYYNMVEDMKGKIRVYARARPLSRSELERGNHNIISSPDEYSLIVQTSRGPKDFQYDMVFTPDQSQEKVFEDTQALIQSAVDGYNVCIFAYGQTGSGKTYTMIGDNPNKTSAQQSPGIAPRAFKAIYELINENSAKFSFTTHMYMMELYMDKLIDLYGAKGVEHKLDIKKDKKGMVIVQGAIIKEAKSAEEMMDLFDLGGSQRHVASTKMNSESSRSHLVVAIVIESTNLSNGQVIKGKLSIVDLAGSERAAKTEASAEQLKEAQSINKSLSALGDVISSLSSEQSFIPYRNNKLTMLMQDSLGGNAKTLMFVNISPADYNADETVTSLTYASRVKLITNDASKNSDNKEIARLKQMISKMKKGEAVDEEDAE